MAKSNDIPPAAMAVYHELSGRIGQTMTMSQVMAEMQITDHATARKTFPAGWIGSGRGLRMRTLDFAIQLAAMREG